MHIHKPKAAHSLREFLSEIGVIVIGVLIALAMEQAVEWMHWRHEVEAERRSLLAEARDNLESIKYREIEQPCVDARLQQVHTLLQRHERRQPLGLIGPMGRHIRSARSRGSWDIALADGALAHMGRDDRLAFSAAFRSYEKWDKATEQEAEAWRKLAPLNEPDLLDDQDWSNLKAAYWEAVQINEGMRDSAPFYLKYRTLGLKIDKPPIPPGFEGAHAAMCRPFVAASV